MGVPGNDAAVAALDALRAEFDTRGAPVSCVASYNVYDPHIWHRNSWTTRHYDRHIWRRNSQTTRH